MTRDAPLQKAIAPKPTEDLSKEKRSQKVALF